MKQEELSTFIRICINRIKDGYSFDDIKVFILEKQNEEVLEKVKSELLEYIEANNLRDINNKLYWMLICNPKMWYEDTEKYQVNQLLFDLDKDSIEPWKINVHTNMELQMKKGHRGIIKVSNDDRTQMDRMDEDGTIVDKLEAGIYGIFEVVEDEDGDCTFECKSGEYFVNIKVIDNFYAKGTTISKEKSKELLGTNIYNSKPSTKIKKILFENIVNFQAR